MKNKYKYLTLLFLCVVVAFLTFAKSPRELTNVLNSMASETKQLALFVHGIFLILFTIALAIKKTRDIIFSLLILFLSGLATFMASKYQLIPNVIVFGTIFILSIISIIKKEMLFDVSNIETSGKIIAFISIAMGLYYLHWIETPIWKNALFYSPLGIINCPTLVTICGLLIFLKKPGLSMLELFTGFITLYFGFFGIMRLGAEVDFILIIASIYLIFRQISKLENNIFYK